MRKTVLVLTSGIIPELNNVSGPINTPTRIDIKNIKMMVKNGRNVQECDPKDPWNNKKRVTLTMENFLKDNFSGTDSSDNTHDEEKVENEAPEVKEPAVDESKDETPVEEPNVAVDETATPVKEKVEDEAPEVKEPAVDESKDETPVEEPKVAVDETVTPVKEATNTSKNNYQNNGKKNKKNGKK